MPRYTAGALRARSIELVTTVSGRAIKRSRGMYPLVRPLGKGPVTSRSVGEERVGRIDPTRPAPSSASTCPIVNHVSNPMSTATMESLFSILSTPLIF